VDVVGWWEGAISLPGNSDAYIVLVFVDDPHLGVMTNVGIASDDPYIVKQFTGGSFSVSGNTVTFTTEEMTGHCDANFNGTGTVSGNYMFGTFGGSDCTLTLSNASFIVKRTR